jgi:hypothetical protein
VVVAVVQVQPVAQTLLDGYWVAVVVVRAVVLVEQQMEVLAAALGHQVVTAVLT